MELFTYVLGDEEKIELYYEFMYTTGTGRFQFHSLSSAHDHLYKLHRGNKGHPCRWCISVLNKDGTRKERLQWFDWQYGGYMYKGQDVKV